MVVRIRLARWGQRNRPFYRIVAADARSPRDGRHLEVLGTYTPIAPSHPEAVAAVKRVALNVARIQYWLSTGAQPTDTVKRLLGSAALLPLAPRSIPRSDTVVAAFSSPASTESGLLHAVNDS